MRSSKLVRSVKTYAASGSPGRCRRVVHDLLNHRLGSRSTSALTIVPLPTPPGPERTMMSESAVPSLTAMASLAELIEQCLLLHCAETLDAAVVGDSDVFHDLARLHLADARQGLEQRHDLELADGDAVRCESLTDRHGSVLQLVLQFSTCSAGLSSLGQSGRSLFGRELGRCCHEQNPSPDLASVRGIRSMTCADELGDRFHTMVGTPLRHFAKYLHRGSRADEIGGSDLHRARSCQHQLDGAPAICHTADADNWQVRVRIVH